MATQQEPMSRRRPPAALWTGLVGEVPAPHPMPQPIPSAVRPIVVTAATRHTEPVRIHVRVVDLRRPMAQQRMPWRRLWRRRVGRFLQEWGPGLAFLALLVWVVVTQAAGIAVEVGWLRAVVTAAAGG